MLVPRSAAVLAAMIMAAYPAAVADAPRFRPVPAEWRVAWSMRTDLPAHPPSFETPRHAVSGDALAVATREGGLRIHDLRTGELRRTVPTRTEPITGVWIAADVLVVSRGAPDQAEKTLEAHDLATGAVRWRRTIAFHQVPMSVDLKYLDSPIMVTERGIMVFERSAEPVAAHALDLRTGATTARTTYTHGCDMRSAATPRAVVLLSHCAGARPQLASLTPRTLRPAWTRPLTSPFAALEDAYLSVTTNAEGHLRVWVGSDDSFYNADGRPLPDARETTGIPNPGRWSPPLFADSYSEAVHRREVTPGNQWPLPAFLVSLDPGTGRLGGLPLDVPHEHATLIGSIRDMAFVHSTVPGDDRITAYELSYGPARGPARFGGVPASAWPPACALLTGRDLSVFAEGYRVLPGSDHLAGTTPAKCDWIPRTDDGAVVSVAVEAVSPSSAGARKLFAAEVAAVKAANAHDPTTEGPGFLSYTLARPTGYLGATIINVGPVIVRISSPSRPAVRLISPLLRDNLLARYRPGVRAPAAPRPRGWNLPADAVFYADPVVARGVVHATSDDGTVYALDATTGAERWRFRMGDGSARFQVPADGTMFAASDKRLVALDAATGRKRWSREMEVSTAPVVSQGRLYIWTTFTDAPNAELVALDAATGRRLWTFRPPGDFAAPAPVVAGAAVHVGDVNGMLYALDPRTGARRWRSPVGGRYDTVHLARTGDMVYAASESGDVRALDAASGKVRWSSQVHGTVDFRPVVTGGIVYLANRFGATYALDTRSGKRLWSFPAVGGEDGRGWEPVVAQGVVYAGGPDSGLHALDATTGVERWSAALDTGYSFRPAVADGAVYLGDAQGVLHAFDAATGRERWRFQTGGDVQTRPVVTKDFVYLGVSNGNLYALPTTTGG
ncbi:PQQ-binding-like beta-propeller repeat protein [Spongiactinospora sp. 9N601]|uniref:outer membrane protein assembly factor BamB family protein n=1 Tax=Spongiactinospora sp. 9N601 TaxID=3375149 RepID=UPI00378E1696